MPDEFMVKYFPRGGGNWRFRYPSNRLLTLVGNTITDDLVHHPDMWHSGGKPCLLVVMLRWTRGRIDDGKKESSSCVTT